MPSQPPSSSPARNWRKNSADKYPEPNLFSCPETRALSTKTTLKVAQPPRLRFCLYSHCRTALAFVYTSNHAPSQKIHDEATECISQPGRLRHKEDGGITKHLPFSLRKHRKHLPFSLKISQKHLLYSLMILL